MDFQDFKAAFLAFLLAVIDDVRLDKTSEEGAEQLAEVLRASFVGHVQPWGDALAQLADLEPLSSHIIVGTGTEWTLTDICACVNEHVAKSNPHPQYLLTTAAGGMIDLAIAAHEASPDPHPQYLQAAPVESVDGRTGDVVLDDLYEAMGAVGAHEGAADPHPQYLQAAPVDSVDGRTGTVTLDDLYEAAGTLTTHESAADPHPQYLQSAPVASVDGRTGAVTLDDRYEATGAVAAHEGAPDPHPQYLQAAPVDSVDGRTGAVDLGDVYEALGAVAEHESAPNPHPQYLTAAPVASVDGRTGPVTLSDRYEALGAVAGHEGAADPHPQYLQAAPVESVDGRVGDVTLGDLYDAAGTALGFMSSHVANPNAHPQYLPAALADVYRGYAQIDIDGHISRSVLPPPIYSSRVVSANWTGPGNPFNGPTVSHMQSGGITFAGGVWTVPVAGWYEVTLTFLIGGASGATDLDIRLKRDAVTVQTMREWHALEGRRTTFAVTTVRYFNAGQTFWVEIVPSSAGWPQGTVYPNSGCTIRHLY